ncbi:MAG: hypothetical protein R3B45_15060 [Bdellovibrionota bacterium]
MIINVSDVGKSNSCLVAITVILCSLFLGCASYTEETRQVRVYYQDQQYAKALKELEDSSVKSQARNRLLYALERALILDKMNKRRQSRALLIEADKIADELYTVSVSKTATSFLLNDSTTDYSGEDYEKVAIHIMLALSFIEDGEYESAQVSARKINHKLLEINQHYEKGKNRYGEDAFARYLSGIIFEARGDWDDALIDYKKALDLYDGGYNLFHRGGIPESLVKAYYKLALLRERSGVAAKLLKAYPSILKGYDKKLEKMSDWGELVVIHRVGHIAVKTNEEFVLPVGRQIVRFSFPVIKPKTHFWGRYDKTGVEVEQEQFFAAENLQNFSQIASKTLEDRRGRLLLKGAARLIAKGQLTEAAYDKFGPLGGLLANIYSAVSETGDTRGWTLLPDELFITRVPLKPGKHKISIKSLDRLMDLKTIEIRKRKILILSE